MSKSDLLSGKKALVTGAGRGIGKSIALRMAQNGADIAIVARTRDDVQATANEIQTNFHRIAVPINADISSKKGAVDIVKAAREGLGAIDILVCAAGYPLIPKIWESELHEVDENDMRMIFETDCLGSFRLVKECLPVMISRQSGVIILFSSTPAIAGYGKGGAYTVSKAANLGMVKEIASAYGKFNIRAYAVAPGNIQTERTYNPLSEEERKTLASESSMKRWGKPEEVADVCVVLASDKMAFVTGQTVVVDGGTVMV